MLCLQIMNIILIKQVWIWNTTIRLQRLTIQVLSWKEYVVRDVYAVSTVLTEMTKKNMFYQSNGKQNHRWTNESVWLACSYIENRIQCIYFICWHVVDCRNVWHNLTQIKRTTVLMKFKAHNQVSARSQLMCFIKLDFWWLLGQPSKRN